MDRTQNHIANAVIFNVGLTSFVRCVRCALQHASRFILDLGDSGLNPCADTRGLAGALSSSVAFNRWLVRSFGVTQANHSRVTTLAVLTTTKKRENVAR